MSRDSRAMVRGPAWSTSSLGRLELGSEVPQGSPAFPGDSRSGRWPTLSTSSPGRLGPMPEGLQARPDVPADLGPCSSACGVDQLSRATRAPVRRPAKLTGSPGPLVRGSVGPRGRPVPPGDSGLGRVSRGHQISRTTRARVRGPAVGQAVFGDSGSGVLPRGVDHLSRTTHARFRGPGGSTSCPEHFGPVSECPRVSTSSPWRLRPGSEGPSGRPAVPDDSCPAVLACGLDKLSWVTQASVRGPVQKSSCPGQLGPMSEGLRCRPANLGNSRWGPRSRGFDQMSRDTRALVRGPTELTSSPGQLGHMSQGPQR